MEKIQKTGPELTAKGEPKKRGSKGKLMGRPKIVWGDKEWKQVDTMCGYQGTGEEIAAVMDVDYDTLNRLCKDTWGVPFSEYYKIKSDRGKMSLRKLQFASAEHGNVMMQIWLGKQVLNQKEKAEAETIGRIEVVGDVPDGD